MKVTPLAQGTGVPAASDVGNPGRTADAGKLARAKAIASGQNVPDQKESGDHQVDRAQDSMKRIKMRTQRSTNRHEVPEQVLEPVEAEIPINDANEQVVDTEETKSINPETAALLKYKRALQVKERELAQREEALKQTPSINTEEYISKADLQANPLKIFEAGVNYDQFTEALLANQAGLSPEIQNLNSKIQSLEKKIEDRMSERDQQSEQQVLSQIERDAEQLVQSDPQYEAIREAKASKKVKELVHRLWKKTGEVLDIKEAADLVENQLIEDAMPFVKIKKVQSRLNPTPEAPAQIPAPQRPNVKVMRTITNRDSASPVLDKRTRAIMAMQGTLKKG